MKTISGNSISTKQISLSKAAKILSKFVSAENGASQVISAYLHRASASFSELNQLHKELKSSRSHKKHKRHIIETHDDKFGRHQLGSENTDEDNEKSTQTVVKFSQEPNDSIGYHAGNVGGSEKRKKNKKKQEVESRYDEDSWDKFGVREDEGKLWTVAQNEIESGRELGDDGDSNTGMEKGKKQKREKKNDKEGTRNFSCNKGKVENPEGESEIGSEHQKEIEKKICNSVEGENGGLVDPHNLQIKKKKKSKAESENNLYAEEVKMVQKRKNEDVEDRSGDLTKKRMKRKREGDN